MPTSTIVAAVAVITGALAGSLTDWIFAGILFHSRYRRHPQTWRAGGSEIRRIAVAQAFTLFTSASMFAIVLISRVSTCSQAFELATLIWLSAPLPCLVANHMFVNIDGRITLSHAVGWLIKLNVIAAIAFAAMG